MHHAILAGFDFAGIDGDGSPRVHNDNAALLDGLRSELGRLFVRGGAAQVGHPVIQEVVGLGFERIGADGNNRVGEFGVFIAVVQLANAHVASRVHLRVVGGAIVNPNVLHLHGAEIELAGAPGVFVTATGAAMIEGRNKQAVLAHVVDYSDRDTRDEIKCVIPARRLHLAVAPDHGVGKTLQLGVTGPRIAHFGHPRSANRAKAGIHHAILVGLDDDVDVFAVLPNHVVHRRRVPRGRFGILLLAEIDAEFVLVRRGSALLVVWPCVGFVAAADDAIVAGDVKLLRVLGNDREAVDLTFVSHGFLPQSTLDSRPYSNSSMPSAKMSPLVSTRSTYCGRFCVVCPQIC
jgi:hypothetical protein